MLEGLCAFAALRLDVKFLPAQRNFSRKGAKAKRMTLKRVLSTITIAILYNLLVIPAPAQSVEDQIVTTTHQVTVEGKVLKYSARAGRLPILNNETGEVHAQIFFTSYTLET